MAVTTTFDAVTSATTNGEQYYISQYPGTTTDSPSTGTNWSYTTSAPVLDTQVIVDAVKEGIRAHSKVYKHLEAGIPVDDLVLLYKKYPKAMKKAIKTMKEAIKLETEG